MIRFYPSVFNGKIKAPACEAHAQRLIFAASMGIGPASIYNVPDCANIDASRECLEAFGSSFYTDEFDKGALVVEPFVKTNPVPTAFFNFGTSAATARFTLPIAAAMGIRSDCTASESFLNRRQMFTLTSRMSIRGVSFTNFSLPFTMEGRLSGGEYRFSGEDDPQYISALMMALPVLRDSSDIVLDSPLRDESTVTMTINELARFGILIEKTQDGYHIPGGQSYGSVRRLTVENDWALANMWVTAGVFSARQGGRVEIEGLSPDSPQLYRNTAPVYALLSQDFSEINIDCSLFPNMATVFGTAAAFKGAVLRLSGFPQLRMKDSDRFKNMEQLVAGLGGSCVVHEDGIDVIGNPEADYSDALLDTMGDPWMFMSIAASAALLRYPVRVADEGGADKLYRRFLNDYSYLGGRYEVFDFFDSPAQKE